MSHHMAPSPFAGGLNRSADQSRPDAMPLVLVLDRDSQLAPASVPERHHFGHGMKMTIGAEPTDPQQEVSRPFEAVCANGVIRRHAVEPLSA